MDLFLAANSRVVKILCSACKPERVYSVYCRVATRNCFEQRMNSRSFSISQKFRTSTTESIENDGPRKHAQTTMAQEEVDKFSRLAQKWWDEGGEFAALHTMNQLRVPLIRDGLLVHSPEGNHRETTSNPLHGLKIMDVGCGGGILSEPLARLGAHVVGLDASPENIDMAEWHANLDPGLASRLQYRCNLVEDVAGVEAGSYDGVVASEILEHVADSIGFVAACVQLIKPGGSIFFTTLNKTFLSNALAVFAAERILGVVPAGSHDWNKFVPPDDLKFMLRQNGMEIHLVHGMILNPWSLRWKWIKDISMNYAIHAVKPVV